MPSHGQAACETPPPQALSDRPLTTTLGTGRTEINTTSVNERQQRDVTEYRDHPARVGRAGIGAQAFLSLQ